MQFSDVLGQGNMKRNVTKTRHLESSRTISANLDAHDVSISAGQIWVLKFEGFSQAVGLAPNLFAPCSIVLSEGSLEVKLPTIWTDEKHSRAEAERRDRSEERRVEE